MVRPHLEQQTQNQHSLCEICGKSFANKSKLKHHTRLHLPIDQRRSFECYICRATFAYKKSLVHHMPIHSGQKIQLQCNVCQSQFSRSDALRRHALIHQGKLPHQCQYCSKGFRTKFNLKVIQVNSVNLQFSQFANFNRIYVYQIFSTFFL